MIPIRQSSAGSPNQSLQEASVKEGQSNSEWLKEIEIQEGIILLGGTSVSHFRLRVAQSHLRNDLTPSCWSQAGILLDGQSFLSVPLNLPGDPSDVARSNGVQRCRIKDYDDPESFPNIAVVGFPAESDVISENARRVIQQRSIVDLPALVLPWLAYVMSIGQSGNPLSNGVGIPSAVFVETVYGMAGVELTPGLSSSTSCPEAIWQSAKWWHSYYEKDSIDRGVETEAMQVPTGSYLVRQQAAAAVGPKDEVVDGLIVSRSLDDSVSKPAGKAKSTSKKSGKKSNK